MQVAAGLRSSRLTLVVLFLLALLASVGTIPRAADAPGTPASPGPALQRFFGIESTFSSPLFLALAGLLVVNILFCTVHRFRRSKRGRGQRFLDLVMHLSLVLVAAGGVLKVNLGVVRTVAVPVGAETSAVYDWKSGTDVPLDFTLRVVRFETEYYPFRARVGVRDPRSGEKIGVAEVVEGRPVPAPGGGELGLEEIDRERASATFSVRTPGDRGRVSLALAGGPGATTEFGGRGFTLLAFRDEEKSVRALVNIVRENGLVSERWLSTNGSLEVDGTKIFLTAWGRDRFLNPFAGFQVSRDPGAPLFWTGCVLLAAAMPLYFVAKRRRRGEEAA